MFQHKVFLFFPLIALTLASCAPVTVSRQFSAVQVQPGPPGIMADETQTPVTEGKVVKMVTQTPEEANNLPDTPDPAPVTPTTTGTSPVMPKSLAELGYQVATYQDEYAGFAFDYPAGWKINTVSEDEKQNTMIYSITLRSGEAPRAPKQQEGVPDWMVAIDVTVFNHGPATLEQAIAERRSAATNGESGQTVIIQAEEDWVLTGGLKAHRFLYNLGSSAPDTPDSLSSELVTMIKGRMVLISGFGDQSMFNIIAATLREINAGGD